MQSRKETAWKKSRKFGDVKGGRRWPKRADNIFAGKHSLQRPAEGDTLPIFISDNPSRDYFFPIGPDEVRQELDRLPREDWKGITHIWFRRFKKTEYEADEIPLAEFSCGSGVRLITLYPWPRNLEWVHGAKQPTPTRRRILRQYGAELSFRNGAWISKWTAPSLKNFYIENLLFHEIGFHVDYYYRNWSKANGRAVESVASQYAFSMTTKRSEVYKAEPEDAGKPPSPPG